MIWCFLPTLALTLFPTLAFSASGLPSPLSASSSLGSALDLTLLFCRLVPVARFLVFFSLTSTSPSPFSCFFLDCLARFLVFVPLGGLFASVSLSMGLSSVSFSPVLCTSCSDASNSA
ncbi:uncharacterized protein SPPG_09364 [Spizellomyces punctatus DAOM BR117]|uniref:Secreted peptide n=1 Tax=Spizellomyces punctatus (strain DAOM BR117) TaxID=645134 RepID=A0A0L0HCR4_SPIPD|nr:uncharacterized protein SPPG_09364 [Spizellomyces punctatus DAOM BR117]KNC98694.1 hypothetical protein SPPG_09364 [Spizellomyces punctatus DAOM BR117]|eukprot:XP_016606734.1 hypothetical protein SPPG_09364 [Spizellomyces punctatus DAOM BR117]